MHTMSKKETRLCFISLFVAIIIFVPFAFIQTKSVFDALNITFSPSSKWFLVLSIIYIVDSLVGIAGLLFIWHRRDRFERLLDFFAHPNYIWRWGVVSVTIVAGVIFSISICHPTVGMIIHGFWMRLTLLWWVIVLGMFAIKIGRNGITWSKALMASATVAIVGLQVLTYLPGINNYPFSLGWSEGSYIYYASLVAAPKLYGMQLPMSIVYPSRALLESVPFLVGNFPIWVHRLWSAVLWLGITSTTSLFLVSRLKISDRLVRWSFFGWVFLYLIQGYVKYELQVCVIIVLLGVSARHPWRSLVCVLLASFWAGMSRLNWYPVPGVLAALLYLLEEPVQNYRTIFRYLSRPAVWFILGVGVAFGGSMFTLHLTNNNWKTLFSFGFSQSFWYRMFPNPTNPLGFLTGAILYSLPLWGLMVFIFRKSLASWHPIRLLGMGVIILVLFAGGLLVSSKIGGGADLHNLDAYMVALVITGGYVAFHRFTPETQIHSIESPLWILITIALFIQLGFVFQDIRPIQRYDYQAANQDLQKLQSYIVASASQGDILFIDQRQLLTFRYVDGVKLVPDYELVELDGMANLGNMSYLNKFYDDLNSHRFSMIITYTLNDAMQGSNHAFGEENDAWVLKVAYPILCAYESMDTLQVIGVTFYIPRYDANCDY